MIQPKLTLGAVGDKYEQEADRVAKQVVNQINLPASQSSTQSQSVQRQETLEDDDELRMKPVAGTIQRMETLEEKDELQMRPVVQRLANEEGGAIAPDLEASIQQLDGGGHPLPDSLRQPMEQAFGVDFKHARVHTGTQAEQINQALNSRACTVGQNMIFRQAEYRPESRQGQELIAHEATHMVQQLGKTHLQTQSATTGAIVQAKLKGTYSAMAAVGTTGFRWSRILKLLREYEVMENAQVERIKTIGRLEKSQNRRPPRPMPGAKIISPETMLSNAQRERDDKFRDMKNMLSEIEKLSATWQERHKDAESDYTLKQLQAIRILLPRVRAELTELTSDRFSETGRFGELTTVQENAVGGALSKLDIVEGQTNFKGFFKEEKPTDKSTDQTETLGLYANQNEKVQDPQWGARSIAMNRLDQLLRTDVLIKTEFTVSKRTQKGKKQPTMGVVLAEAEGIQASEAFKGNRVVYNEFDPTLEDKKTGGEIIRANDEVLQRSLIKLQMLDALAGQIDRHQGNYFIQTDAQGNVIGVQGIDNDLAFGVVPLPYDLTKEHKYQFKLKEYRGLPPIVDEETAEKMLDLTKEDIHSALDGLLAPEAVDQTVQRLEVIQTKLNEMKGLGLFRTKFDEQTYQELGGNNESYAGAFKEIALDFSLQKILEKTDFIEAAKLTTTRQFKTQKEKEETANQDLVAASENLTSRVSRKEITLDRAFQIASGLSKAMKTTNKFWPEAIKSLLEAYQDLESYDQNALYV
ncbi:MAG: DUF4157 domain-containing protein [Cyanobacteria bacterium CRU_2_1]|nr:DUF4157 domain-containing protein [Cyanobacteria bacterium CRU_2_1]